jgi:carbon monoxide dehydrogenase subunit G
VFELLTSPEVVLAALPAVRSHRVVGPDRWEAKVKPPLPLAPSVKIHFELVERCEPDHAELRAHGGGTNVRSTFDLEDDGGATLMRWHTELHLGGPLGMVAGHGLDAVARRQAERTLDEVTRRL